MKYLILLLILLVGCTSTTEIELEVECPEPIQKPDPIPTLTITKIHAGQEPVFIAVNDETNLYNCGSVAYGPVVAQKVERIDNLIITKTTPEAIGGCPDIIREFPSIDQVRVYGEVRVTDTYNELIKWIPPHKLRIMDGNFTLMHNNTEIILDQITDEVSKFY